MGPRREEISKSKYQGRNVKRYGRGVNLGNIDKIAYKTKIKKYNLNIISNVAKATCNAYP